MVHRILTALALAALSVTMAHALAESEPNNDRSSANGPFGFPDTITGNSQNDGSTFLEDYFRFTATVGTEYSFVANVSGGFLGPDLALAIENASGGQIAAADVNGDGGGESLTFTPSTTGTYYLVAYEATATPNVFGNYSIAASITSLPPDETAPTWASGNGLAGTRLPGNTSVKLDWVAASDDRTAPANIDYRIYYDAAQANVFVGAPEATVTGTLTSTIAGLDAATTYYFGLRAEDEAGNVNTNSVTIEVAPLPNAVRAGWQLYE